MIGLTWAFFQHLCSGLRHFVLDTGAGYELKTNKSWSVAIPFISVIATRSEEHTSELQSLMRISYAVFCLKKKKKTRQQNKRQYLTTTTQYKTHQQTTKHN